MNQLTTLPNPVVDISNEEILELIFNNTCDAYLLIDRNLQLVILNNEAQKKINQLNFKTPARRSSILDLVAPERHPLLKELYEDVLQGNTRKTEIELEIDNKKRCYENMFIPAYDSNRRIVGVIVRSTDITEKKKIETGIKEAEERWQFALDAAVQAAWDWNLQTNEVIYSTSYKKIYGFTGDEITDKLFEWTSRIHPEDKKKMENALQEHLSSANPYYETTYRIRLSNGEYKWIMARGKIIAWTDEGRPLRMIGTHTDLTKSLQTKQELRKANERFTYAAKATSQTLWEWDIATGKTFVSQNFTELFGWDAGQNQTLEQWQQFIHPEDRERTITNYNRHLQDPSATIWEEEYRFLKTNGTYAIVSDKAYLLRDENGKLVRVIGAMQDITALKKTEEALIKSNQRYDIMLKATNELLWEWDLKTDEIYKPLEGIQRVYGLEDDSTIKNVEQWLKRVHPEDQEKISRILGEARTGEHLQIFEVEFRFLGGRDRYEYIYGRGIVLRDADGNPASVVGAEQNISERKRLESELLKNERENQKLINQATVDSQEQERGEIGKELHDNVNQVLTTTKLYLELALQNEDLMKELIKKSSTNISMVINEIRQLSRSLMDPSLGDLGMIDSLNDLIENINLTRKISISLRVDQTVEEILTKNQKLTIFRIIQEALNNVIKHAKAKFVSIDINKHEEIIELVVSDDGIGFVYESIKKGIGLKNITNRVYLINGLFLIDSNPGEGCRIKISFPINNQE